MVKSVDGVTFHIQRGETLAVVGVREERDFSEHHAADRDAARQDRQGGDPVPGKDGVQKNLVTEPENETRKNRGNDISMIFQAPMASLKKDGMEAAVQMLELVGILAARKRVNGYPHQMSYGIKLIAKHER